MFNTRKLEKLKKIPRFATPAERVRELDDLEVKVRRVNAWTAGPVIARMLRELGEILSAVLSYDEEHAPEVEGEDGKRKRMTLDRLLDIDIDGMSWGKIGQAAAGAVEKVDPGDVKLFVLETLFPQLQKKLEGGAPETVNWLIENVLPGHLAVRELGSDDEWTSIDSMEELDALGGDYRHTMRLLFFALEVNFFRTSSGRDTSPGNGQPGDEPGESSQEGRQEPEALPSPPPPKPRKLRGGKRKAGQSAPMSTTTGGSGGP